MAIITTYPHGNVMRDDKAPKGSVVNLCSSEFMEDLKIPRHKVSLFYFIFFSLSIYLYSTSLSSLTKYHSLSLLSSFFLSCLSLFFSSLLLTLSLSQFPLSHSLSLNPQTPFDLCIAKWKKGENGRPTT